MAANNKIEQMGMGPEILDLHGQGKSTAAIAAYLNEKHGPGTTSQRSVARWLQEVRNERRSETKAVVHDYIKKTVPADLEALDAVEAFFLDVFRNMDHNQDWIRSEFARMLEEETESCLIRSVI